MAKKISKYTDERKRTAYRRISEIYNESDMAKVCEQHAFLQLKQTYINNIETIKGHLALHLNFKKNSQNVKEPQTLFDKVATLYTIFPYVENPINYIIGCISDSEPNPATHIWNISGMITNLKIDKSIVTFTLERNDFNLVCKAPITSFASIIRDRGLVLTSIEINESILRNGYANVKGPVVMCNDKNYLLNDLV